MKYIIDLMQNIPKSKFVFREECIYKNCKSKKVFHLGCADSPKTIFKFNDNLLLHVKLRKVAYQLAGIDINAESINWLKMKGITNIWVADAHDMAKIIPHIGFVPEIFVAGEILEHPSEPF